MKNTFLIFSILLMSLFTNSSLAEVDARAVANKAIEAGFTELESAFLVSFAYRDAIAMGLLFLLLVFRPQGLFGKRVEDKI